MRIVLIGIQVAVLMTMAFISIAAGGSLASLPALATGVGPAAVGAGVYVLMLFAAAAVGFVAIVIPTSILAATTLVFAITAGYRYLRWTRLLGILANLIAGGVVTLPHFFTEEHPLFLTALLLLYPCGNAILFLLMPRVPRVNLTRRLCRIAVPCLYLPVLATAIFVCTRGSANLGMQAYLFFALFLLLYLFPFYYGYRTLSYTKQPSTALAIRLAILALMTLPVLFVLFPLGLPLGMSLYLLLALSEISLLYPVTTPPPDGVRYWIARTLGRLPTTAEPVTDHALFRPGSALPPEETALPEQQPPESATNVH